MFHKLFMIVESRFPNRKVSMLYISIFFSRYFILRLFHRKYFKFYEFLVYAKDTIYRSHITVTRWYDLALKLLQEYEKLKKTSFAQFYIILLFSTSFTVLLLHNLVRCLCVCVRECACVHAHLYVMYVYHFKVKASTI